MALFLASLAVLFLGGVVAWFVVGSAAGQWPPPGAPALPRGLLASTAFLAVASALLEGAVRAARAARVLLLRTLLIGTVVAAVAFLVSQAVCWFRFVTPAGLADSGLYGWLFYFLTGLHALHVIGGLVPLAVVTVNAHYDRLPPRRRAGLRYVAWYWHFLGLVWLGLYLLFLTAR